MLPVACRLRRPARRLAFASLKLPCRRRSADSGVSAAAARTQSLLASRCLKSFSARASRARSQRSALSASRSATEFLRRDASILWTTSATVDAWPRGFASTLARAAAARLRAAASKV
eukprot:Amastigsp_a339379_252.p3 type:complete len:117 gc:universal Amastigsp_a339379_252:321-671(+)